MTGPVPRLLTGLSGTIDAIDAIRCQELFDYSGYDQPDAVRDLVGMGHPLDYAAPMLAPSVPSVIWGGQVRLIARALDVRLRPVRGKLGRKLA